MIIYNIESASSHEEAGILQSECRNSDENDQSNETGEFLYPPLSLDDGDEDWLSDIHELETRLNNINKRVRHYNLVVPAHLQVQKL